MRTTLLQGEGRRADSHHPDFNKEVLLKIETEVNWSFMEYVENYKRAYMYVYSEEHNEPGKYVGNGHQLWV